MTSTPQVPAAHQALLDRIVARTRADDRLVALLAAGSYGSRSMDAWSDLDLVVVARDEAWPAILEARQAIAAECGPLLSAFTGEHVGEPRLLVCLYGPPLVHVDLKFVTADQVRRRVDEVVVLWERDGAVAAHLAATEARYPAPDRQWIEDRFWVWVHYAATKLGRGELFEAMDFLAFLRGAVLGPLALERAGAQPNGVRRVERAAPDDAARLAGTVAAYERTAVAGALRHAVALYRDLRDAGPPVTRRADAEREAVLFLEAVAVP